MPIPLCSGGSASPDPRTRSGPRRRAVMAVTLEADSIGMLTNSDVLAVDQGPLGVQGAAISTADDTQVWTEPLAGGDVAVALLNRGTPPKVISTTAQQVGLPPAGVYAVRDLWQHTTTESAGKISASVGAHGVLLLRVSQCDDATAIAPSTVLFPAAITPTVQAALPLVVPGDSFPVSASFTDNGRHAVWSVKLALGVPAGWKATPIGSTTASRLGTGQSITASWQVTVSPGTVPGPNDLTVTVGYGWHSDSIDPSGDSPAILQTVSAVESAQVQVPAAPPSGTSPLNHRRGERIPRASGRPRRRRGRADGHARHHVPDRRRHRVTVDDRLLRRRQLRDGGYNDHTDLGGLRITCGAPVPTVPAGPWPHFVPPADESATATSANNGYLASNAVGGNLITLWHLQFSPVHDSLPISLTIDPARYVRLTATANVYASAAEVAMAIQPGV